MAVDLLRRWKPSTGRPQRALTGTSTGRGTPFERAMRCSLATTQLQRRTWQWHCAAGIHVPCRVRRQSIVAKSDGFMGRTAALHAQRYRDLPSCRRRACFSTTQGQPPSLTLQKLIKAEDTTAVINYIQSDPASVDRGDPALNGTTPLLLALRLGHDKIAEALLDNGADVNLAGAWGLTPLMYGAVFGRERVVASMLERSGASINLHATDLHGSTALAHAQVERQHAIVSLLVEHLAEHGDSTPGVESADGVTHSASGFNIKPMVSTNLIS